MWRAVLSARNQDGVNGSLRGAGVQRGGASGASLACRERRSSRRNTDRPWSRSDAFTGADALTQKPAFHGIACNASAH